MTPTRQRMVLWGVLLLAGGLRLFQLGAQSLWIDELYQILDAQLPPHTYVGPRFPFDLLGTHKSPLSLLLHHLLLRAGDGEFLLRLPSVLFSVAEVAAVFLLARLLLGFRTAVLAALFLAISPLHLWYAQEVRYYSLWSLLTTCSFLALAHAWKRGWLLAWVGYAGSMSLGALSFILMAAVAPIQWLSAALLWRHPETPRSFRWIFGTMIGVALLLIVVPILLGRYGWEVGVVGTPRELELLALPYTYVTFVAGFSAGPSVRELHFSPGIREIVLGHPELLLFLAVFLPLVVLGVRGLMGRTPARELLLPLAFGLPLLVYLSALLFENTYNVRYSLPALAAFVVVLAVGIREIRSSRLRWAALFAAVLCTGFSLGNYYFDSRYEKADVRQAVAHIRSGPFAGVPVAVTGQILVAVGYYGEGALEPVGLAHCDGPPDVVTVAPWEASRKAFSPAPAPREAFERAPELWLMSGRDWERRGEKCLAWLEATHRVDERVDFPGIELYRLTRRDGPPEERVSEAPGASAPRR